MFHDDDDDDDGRDGWCSASEADGNFCEFVRWCWWMVRRVIGVRGGLSYFCFLLRGCLICLFVVEVDSLSHAGDGIRNKEAWRGGERRDGSKSWIGGKSSSLRGARLAVSTHKRYPRNRSNSSVNSNQFKSPAKINPCCELRCVITRKVHSHKCAPFQHLQYWP